MKKDFLSILDISREELANLIAHARKLKEERRVGIHTPVLANKTLGMIFEKSSTRTRISFETGMFELGGHALFLNPKDMQLGRGEAICDTARVMTRFVSAIMIRANRHDEVQELAVHADIPVINGLSDKEHPCQILADIMTIEERLFRTDGIKVAWIGDGNNVCTSLILSTILTGMEVIVGSPKEFAPKEDLVKESLEKGAKVRVVTDPFEAARDADVVMTDTWISMGQEDEIDRRREIFMPYQVNKDLLSVAKPGAIVMHCLPAHRNWEITDEVIDSKESAVWDQAENRLHVQKALLVRLLA
ncbi:ornithine carbamoyltransferase [Methanospirillum stamsii]|uniref:Ornithine carbamoyltransferase n=1 Tax=Methanospirillum stamsii TaxID=1277351 RepID=A0A2V2NHU9_9EURY|nr:ornithine carbamoyltransferase [Methanospirillum stamsii]PWR74913.1 ornithine carbamoyltransferase [Methanospirillum stamsii]